MDFSLLTYNTLFNDAVAGLKKICNTQHPDFLCLQEIDTTPQNFKIVEDLGYKLADYSNAFIKYGHIYGVATFYKPEKFQYRESSVIKLPRGVLEIILYFLVIFRTGKKNRTILKSEFYCEKIKKTINIYNVHLSAVSFNGLREKQISKILDDIHLNNIKVPTIVAGDYNFAWGRKKLEELFESQGFREATNTILFTTKGATTHFTFFEKLFGKVFFKLFFNNRVKCDYIFYKNCESVMAKKLDVDYSDHYPVFAVFKIEG